MNQPRLLLSSLVLAPALLAFAAPDTKVAFAVEEGTTLTRAVSTVVDLSLDDMQVLMNGQEPPMMPEMEINSTMTLELEVTDEMVSLREGAPKKLKRTFDSLSMLTETSMEMDMGGQTMDREMPMNAKSELEGTTVVFTWNADEGKYDASFEEDSGDKELLVGLVEDMDLRGLLPPSREVAEGAEWKVDPSVLSTVLAPGGNLKLIPQMEGMEEMMSGMNSDMGSMSDWFQDTIEGEVTATFRGTRTEEGTTLAAIAIVVDITNAVDMTDLISERMAEMELPPEAQDMDIEFDHMDIELGLEGEGLLLWNVGAGRAQSFELSGDFTMAVDMAMSMTVPGMGDLDQEIAMEMSGTLNQNITIE